MKTIIMIGLLLFMGIFGIGSALMKKGEYIHEIRKKKKLKKLKKQRKDGKVLR